MFVVVNVVANMVLLVRSYVTMQVLDYRELGLAALLQTVVLLVGILQMGVLNGGYRLLCSASGDDAQRVNNLVYTVLGLLGAGGLVVTAIALLFMRGSDADVVALLGLVGGLATLGRTWMANQLIAKHALAVLNRINLVSSVGAVAVLAFVVFDPFIACLAAVIAQPLIFVVAGAAVDRSLLPTGVEISRPLIRTVLGAGFVAFLTSMLSLLNVQIERWYITSWLGLDTLGHFYLALLFVTLFQMVPASLDQIFLAPVVNAHDRGDGTAVARILRIFLLLAIGYCVVATVAVAVAARPVLEFLLPKYLPDLRYVYLVTPGLVMLTLSGPFALVFSVLIRFRYYFCAYGVGTVATAAAIAGFVMMGRPLDLSGVVVVRSVSYAVTALLVVAGYALLTRDVPALRFGLLRR
ncbi:MAG: hypothetical protein V4537_16420 [Pseudomonadota bacterium]